MKFIALLDYIVDRLKKAGVRYEVETFPSGALMIDIWINDRLYVVQIEDKIAGLSLVTEETTFFDIIPDQSFSDAEQFKSCFEMILKET